MERNKTIMKLCYLQTTFYIVFLTALITRHRRGISQKTFAFLIILSLVGCAVSLTLGDYLRNMIRSSGFDVAGVHDKKSLEKKLQQLQNADDTLNVGVMMFDLNNLKKINDTYGHDVGDLILKEMAVIFKEVSFGKGFVSRFGGDEFIIILETKDRDALEKIAKDIYARIDATAGFKKQIEAYLGHEITVDAGRLITCSIGIASAANVYSEYEINELIRRADDLLYTVKMGEKGHYKFL